jgi:hypothetical protein
VTGIGEAPMGVNTPKIRPTNGTAPLKCLDDPVATCR